MYALENMIDLCDQEWKSDVHKVVAIRLLIGNPRIVSRNQLIEFGGRINDLSEEDVKALTIEGAVRLGVPFN